MGNVNSPTLPLYGVYNLAGYFPVLKSMGYTGKTFRRVYAINSTSVIILGFDPTNGDNKGFMTLINPHTAAVTFLKLISRNGGVVTDNRMGWVFYKNSKIYGSYHFTGVNVELFELDMTGALLHSRGIPNLAIIDLFYDTGSDYAFTVFNDANALVARLLYFDYTNSAGSLLGLF